MSSSVTIPAGQRNGCVQYDILMDSITRCSLLISTVTTGAVIGNPSGTVVTITDMSESLVLGTSTGMFLTDH